jgi:hypothetical protein
LVEQQQRLQRSKKRKSLASSSKLRNTKKRKADEQQGREQEQQKEQQHDDVIRLALAGEKCSLLQAQFNTAIEVANTIKKNLDLATVEYYAVTNNAPSTRTSIPQDDPSATNATPTNNSNSTTTASVAADEEVDSKDGSLLSSQLSLKPGEKHLTREGSRSPGPCPLL